MRIGILYICTGKYTIFWKDFYLSAERYFFQEGANTLEYYVFTDSPSLYGEKNNKQIHRVYQRNLGWPDNTLMRFHMFLGIEEQLKRDTDFLYYFNANLKFESPAGTDMLPPDGGNGLVGTLHPSFSRKTNLEFDYERRETSQAYIPYGMGMHYYAGGLQGGRTDAYLHLCHTIRSWTDTDLSNGIVATWHDESLLNRYFLENPPFVLSVAYCYVEHWNLSLKPILLLRNKALLKYGGRDYLREDSSVIYKYRYIVVQLFERIKQKMKRIFSMS